MARRWSAVLARIGTPTGDGRIIAPGALTNRELPLPLMWQRVSGDGHEGAVTVGAIESLTIDNANGIVLGEGRWLDVRGSGDAQRQADAHVTGPSVDLFDDLDIIEVQKLVEAGVVGPDLTRNLDDLEYSQMDDGMIVITSARIAGATLVQIPAFAAVSIEMAAEAESESDPEPVQWGLTASASPPSPPLQWFTDPKLEGITPLTVTEEGRVFGHIAPWGQCHIGLPGCVTAPASLSNYAYFHTGSQTTSDGVELPVGTLVAGPRHADPRLAFQAAAQHYDDPTAAVAKVVAGEDEYGIWVSGWILPGVSPEVMEVFRSSPVSGDWRRVGGALELIAVCSVNAPGFPVPRARVAFSSGVQRTFIGCFGIQVSEGTEVMEVSPPVPPSHDAHTARARWAWASQALVEG